MLDTVEKLLDSFFVSANFKKETKIELAHEKNPFCGPIFTTIGVCTDGAWSARR
jgi:hypothetical protein